MGTAPLLWDAKITPMTFKQKIQGINAVQSNNIGYISSNEV